MAEKKIKISKNPDENLILFNNIKKFEKPYPGLKIEEIDADLIIQNPDQPRKNFSQEKLAELIKSIEKNGILQPIVVRKKSAGYEIVFGERRYRAALQLGYSKIPAIIRDDIDDKNSLLMALVENIQREELNPIEMANAYNDLLKELKITQDELSKMIGKSRVAIANTLRLVKLPDNIKQLVNQGKLSEGHARAALSLKTPELQIELCKKIIEEELSVREAESIVNKIASNVSRETACVKDKDEHIVEIEGSLQKILGMRVSIKMKKRNSKVEILCNSQSDLEKIINKLLSN